MATNIETAILEAIHSLVGISGFLDGVMVFCARFLAYIAMVIFLSKLLVHREPYERLTKIFYATLALVIGAGVLQGILGYVVTRDIPAVTNGVRSLLEAHAVFPAFAVTWTVTIAMVAAVAISKRLGFWLMLFSVVIGFAQLYTGVYRPLDVMVSFVIGVAGALIAKRLIPLTKS